MSRVLLKIAVCLTCLLMWSASASACPNCKAANETDSNLPRAYMYSILFMIGMPATIFTGFGISFYRMASREEQQLEVQQLTVQQLTAQQPPVKATDEDSSDL